MSAPQFKLFRADRPTPNGEYVGTLVTPEGRVYLIEAGIVEHTTASGEKRKHFEGKVFVAQMAPQSLLRGAKLEGSRRAVPQQVLDLMEPPPFNDEIPREGGVSCGGG